MQKKKNILLMVSLIILLGTTGFLFWRGEDDRSFDVDKALFRVDATAISKVTLESPSGTVNLSYNGSKWQLNDQHPVDPNMIDVLFATLQQAVPRKPVASALLDSVSRDLKEKGVKVSLYAGDNLEKVFYAGGNAQKTAAYFRLPEGIPYIMIIPGYRVYTSGILEIPESGWKDKYVFGFNWRSFQRLEAEFPAEQKHNFKVAMSKDFFGIEGLAKVDTARLNSFLDEVSLLTVDQYVDSKGVVDSLSTLSPKMVIRVFDIAKREYRLSIYSPGKGRKEVYGLIGDTQAALFSLEKIGPLIRPKEFFVGQ